jgi:putative FmdB family regulatory protein
MPNYTYKCKDCKNINEMFISLDDFENEVKCKDCNSTDMSRVFKSPNSKIRRTKEEVIESAKEEARDIARKISEGNTSLIRDIYGEEK